MKSGCEKWTGQLVDAALLGVAGKELEEHLLGCENCAAQLKSMRARRARLDALLPQVVRGAELSADFRERVLAAAEASRDRTRVARGPRWAFAGAVAGAATVVVALVVLHRQTEGKIQVIELETAQKLAEWRAPTDTLLATPGQEILRTTPKLGELYLNVPAVKVEEER